MSFICTACLRDAAGKPLEPLPATREVCAEGHRAQLAYGDFASAHEAYGVLEEEVAELFDAIRLKQSDPTRADRIRAEAIQVSAVALRLAEQARRLTR